MEVGGHSIRIGNHPDRNRNRHWRAQDQTPIKESTGEGRWQSETVMPWVTSSINSGERLRRYSRGERNRRFHLTLNQPIPQKPTERKVVIKGTNDDGDLSEIEDEEEDPKLRKEYESALDNLDLLRGYKPQSSNKEDDDDDEESS